MKEFNDLDIKILKENFDDDIINEIEKRSVT